MRKSNFELLKIVCILMVITLHYLNPSIGGALGNVINGSFNYYIIHFIESLCIVAVNVFIIITGYFSYKKTSIKIAKPLYLFYLSIFYGVIIYFGMLCFSDLSLNFDSLFALSKTIFNRWFVIVYIILYLLIPYLNKLINNISQNNLKKLIIINTIAFYVIPTIYLTTLLQDKGYGIVNFVNLYLIGCYIGKYVNKDIPKYRTILVYLLCAIITTVISCFTSKDAYMYNSIFNLIGSIALFLTFKNLKLRDYSFINNLSSYAFSTYIIHENYFLAFYLFNYLFKTSKYYNSPLLFLNLFVTIFGIYIITIITEFIRRIILKKLDNKINSIKYQIEVK